MEVPEVNWGGYLIRVKTDNGETHPVFEREYIDSSEWSLIALTWHDNTGRSISVPFEEQEGWIYVDPDNEAGLLGQSLTSVWVEETWEKDGEFKTRVGSLMKVIDGEWKRGLPIDREPGQIKWR